MKKSGPETAQIGSTLNYDIVVVNTGTTEPHDVVVTDSVPEGLQSSDGQKTLTFKVGDLPPNQPRSIPVSLKAVTRGRHCNTLAVASSNAGKAADEICTTVLQPGLNLIKTGDQERFLGRKAAYRIQLHNTGDTTLTNVVVTDTAPEATSIVSAEGAAITGNQAVWRLERLAPSERKTFDVLLTSTTPGMHCDVATVTAGGGLQDRVKGILDAARKRIDERKWAEALALLEQLTGQQLTSDEENALRSLKEQVQQGARAAGAIRIGGEINRLLEESKTPR